MSIVGFDVYIDFAEFHLAVLVIDWNDFKGKNETYFNVFQKCFCVKTEQCQ